MVNFVSVYCSLSLNKECILSSLYLGRCLSVCGCLFFFLLLVFVRFPVFFLFSLFLCCMSNLQQMQRPPRLCCCLLSVINFFVVVYCLFVLFYIYCCSLEIQRLVGLVTNALVVCLLFLSVSLLLFGVCFLCFICIVEV